MKEIPDNSIDMILTDLPYGTTKCTWDQIIPLEDYVIFKNEKVGFSKFLILTYHTYSWREKEAITYFEENKKEGLWSFYNRIAKENAAILLFGQEPFSSLLRTSNIENYKYDIYWEKERLTNINQVKRRVGKTVETISVFYKKQCTYNPQMIKYDGKPRTNKVKDGKLGKLTDDKEKKVLEYHDTGWRYPTQVWKYQRDCLKSNLHKTQKPLLLCEDLIKTFSNEGDTILDSCMGSNTTGLACMNTNRKFIGIEKEEDIFEIAVNRIKEL
jgi:site-specific DNA-methyltransferase (adenine-specific)